MKNLQEILTTIIGHAEKSAETERLSVPRAPARGLSARTLEDRILYSVTPLMLDESAVTAEAPPDVELPTGGEEVVCAGAGEFDGGMEAVELFNQETGGEFDFGTEAAASSDISSQGNWDDSLADIDFGAELNNYHAMEVANSVERTLDGLEQLLNAESADILAPDFTLSADTQSELSEDTSVEVVLLDSRLEDADALAAAAQSGAVVLTFDGETESAEQILSRVNEFAETSQQHIASLSILSHGSEGGFQLGTDFITTESLRSMEGAWRELAAHLTDDADLAVYGCNVAGSAAGQTLLQELAVLTGADVAGSDDLTGAAELGGDWDFEYFTSTPAEFTSRNYANAPAWNHTLATIAVTTTTDENNGNTSSITALNSTPGGSGISLREAIIAANNTAGSDTIILASGTYTLTITGATEEFGATGDLDISSTITITGAGMGLTIINGNSIDRIFDVSVGGGLTLSDMKLTGGSLSNGVMGGGALSIQDSAAVVSLTRVDVNGNNNAINYQGGGIYNAGTLNLTDSLVRNNSVSNVAGGGIYNTGTMTLTRVSIVNNSAAGGGGIYQDAGTSTLTNVTVSGNTSVYDGAGMQVAGGTVNVYYSTFAANDATQGNGGGIHRSAGIVNVQSSIFGDNTSMWGGKDLNGAITSLGHNIIEHSSGITSHVSDALNIDAGLSALAQDVSSQQYSHAINSGSAALGHGGGTAPSTDIRGVARGGSPDAGAYEANAAPVLSIAPSVALSSVNEDAAAPSGAVGTLVSNLVDFSGGGGWDNVSDSDGSVSTGIAVSAADATNGTWYYTTDGGANWLALGGVSGINSRLLAADANTRIYFRPTTANYNGAIGNALTFRAWDQSAGSNGGTADTTTNGGTTAFSSNSETASIAVTAVNDAPVLALSGYAGAFTEGGAAIYDPGATVTDVDSADFAGGNLTYLISSGGGNGDVLSIRHQGSGAGQIGVSGSNVTYGGVVIGTTSGNGDGSTPMVVTFNSNASVAAVQALARNVTYQNVGDNPGNSTRSFNITFNDGDGGTSNVAVVNVSMTAVNDAPVNSTPGAQSLNEDATLIFSAANGNAISISDVDANSSLMQVTLTGTNGFVTLSTTSGLSFSTGDGTADGTMTFTGTVSNINAALSGMSFGANANYNGAASIQIVTNDQGNSGTGGVLSDTDTINITVNSVNDAPTGTDKTIIATEDTAYTFTASDFGFGDANDSPTDALSGVRISTLPGVGTLRLNGVNVTAGQTISVANINSGLLRWTPATQAHGANVANFTFQVQDNGGTANGGVNLDQSPNTITFDVNSVNDAPSGANKTITTLEDTGYALTVSDFGFGDANDSPANSLSGVRITTLPTNGTLTLSGGGVTAGQTVSAADINSGLLVWTPASNAQGNNNASFTFQVQDDGGTANGGVDLDQSANTITFNVTSVSDAPTGMDKTITTTEDTVYTLTASDFGFGDAADAPAHVLSAVRITTIPGSGALRLNGVAVTAGQSISVANLNSGLLRWTPAANANGASNDSFTFQVQDNGSTTNGGLNLDQSPNTITFDVTPLNDEQAIATNVGATVSEGSSGNAISNLQLSTTDIDNSAGQLIYTVSASPLHGVLRLSGIALGVSDTFTQDDINSGLVTYDHNGTETSSDAFSFTVDDGAGTTSAGTFGILVTGVNDNTPVITSNGGGSSANLSMYESFTTVTTVTVSDADIPPSTITYSIVGGSDAGRFSIDSATGVLSFVVAPDYEAPSDSDIDQVYSVTVQASDGSFSDQQDISVTILDAASTLIVDTTADTNDTGLGGSFTIEQLNASKGADGHISLREAIIAANNTINQGGNPDLIEFNIAVTDAGFTGVAGANGRFVINFSSALPAITEAVIIDGSTQTINQGDLNPGLLGSGGAVGVDGAPLSQITRSEISIVGKSGIAAGFDISANNVTIRGLAMRGFSSGAGIRINNGYSGTLIEGNIFGSNVDAMTDPGGHNTYHVQTVGGDAGIVRNNLFAFADSTGVFLSTASDNWLIEHNEFHNNGISFSNGDAIAANSSNGLTIQGNLITGTSTQGIILSGTTNSVLIQNNTVTGNGVGPAGQATSQSDAIAVRTGVSNITIYRNVIADNYGAGISVNNGATGVLISQNSMFGNGTILSRNGSAATGQVDIDLQGPSDDTSFGTGPYHTANDTGDSDSGGNQLQNFPVITGAQSNGAQITLSGTLNSTENRTIRIEFFANSAPGASGYGGGKRYLGYVDVVTDSNGDAIFSTTLTAFTSASETVTATATDLTTHSTSEFSYNLAINEAPVATLDAGALAYTENSGAVCVAPGAAVTDGDLLDFAGAELSVQLTNNAQAEDYLAIRHQGVGLGEVGVSGTDVTYGGVVIGTYGGGVSGGAAMTITFNSSATASGVQAVLANITYENNSEDPSTLSRTFSATVTDGDGGVGATVTRLINPAKVNDAPVLDSGPSLSLTTITEDNTSNSGNSVASILASGGDPISDVDVANSEGIAITGLTSGNGTWQYSTDGVNWNNIGAVSNNSALLLRSTDHVRFIPDAQNADSASFSFRAWDQTSGAPGDKVDVSTNGATTAFSALTSSASVSVLAVNDAPFGADKTVTVNEDASYTLSAADFGFGDTVDSPANALSAVRVTSIPGSGSLTLNGVAVTGGQMISIADINAGLLVWTSAANVHGAGTANFAFQVQDDGGTAHGGADLDPTANTITFDVNAVNDAPNGADKIITTTEDATYTMTAADFGFGDALDSPSNLLMAVRITTLPGAGSLSLNGVAVSAGQSITVADLNSGLLVFAPAANANGAVYSSFTFQVQDDGGTASGGADLDAVANTITFDVSGVNDAPSAVVPGAQATPTNVPLTFSSANENLISIGDIDSASAPVEVQLAASDGVLTLSGVAGLTFTAGANNSGSMTIRGTTSDINAALAGMIYAPDAGFGGAASLSLVVNDLGNQGLGGPLSDSQTIDIKVGTPGIVITPSGGLNTSEGGATAGFTIVLTTRPTADVTISLSSTDTTEATLIAGSVTFTAANWNLAQTITITGVNDFVDDGDIAYSLVTSGATSADADYSGMNPADFALTNMDDDTAGFTVTPISGPVNEAGGQAFFSVVLNSQPIADVSLQLSSSDLTEASIDLNSLTFTGANWNLARIVTVTGLQDYANDGDNAFTIFLAAATSGDANYNGLNPAEVAAINLEMPNLAPVNHLPGAAVVNEDTTLTLATSQAISISDSDAGGNVMRVALNTAQGVFSLSRTTGLSFLAGDGAADDAMEFEGNIADINAALDGLSYRAAAHFHGIAQLSMTTSDLGNSGTGGALTDSDVLSILVTSVNDRPFGASNAVTVSNTQTTIISAAALLANDGDIDSPNLSVVLLTQPQFGRLVQLPDGNLLYLPDFSSREDQTIQYAVFDGTDYSDPITLTLQPEPLAPMQTAASSRMSVPSAEIRDRLTPGGESDSTNSDDTHFTSELTTHSGESGSDSADLFDVAGNELAPIDWNENDDEADTGVWIDESRADSERLSSIFAGALNRPAPKPGQAGLLDANRTYDVMDLPAIGSALAKIRQEMETAPLPQQFAVGVVTVGSASMAAGYVFWALRGAQASAMLLSATPTWATFDLLPVLAGGLLKKRGKEEDESLGQIASDTTAASKEAR